MNFSDGSPLQHFFYLSFSNRAPSRLIIGWEGIFNCKGFECNEILHHFTTSKSVRSCVIFIQALTKCFSLPANGTTGMFFGKNNLLSMGEPFLIPNELVFLDLNPCCRSFTVIPTISLCDNASGAPIPSTTRYSQLYRVEPSYMEYVIQSRAFLLFRVGHAE